MIEGAGGDDLSKTIFYIFGGNFLGRKVWSISSYDKNKAAALAYECNADDFAVLLLQSRGIDTAGDIYDFFNTEERELSSPFLMKDMEKAALRIRKAVEEGERIHVFGDYDADGVTATALLTSYLEAIGGNVSYAIPSRLHDGYGLSPEEAERIVKMGVNLVITVDNGIASFEEAEIFKSAGIDFIVTDHHKVGETLPDAYAVIDAHRTDDNSPEENLAGVGVALKLAAAIEDGDYTSVLEDYGDLAAIGTIADIVSLTGENRIIVSKGLKCIKNSYRPGLIKLLESAGIKGDITSTSVAFGVAPRINAAGRMDSALTALQLLLTEDEEEAQSLTQDLISYNTLRQTVENEISEEIEEFFDKEPFRRNDAVIVAFGENWHPGVIGIAASRLVEKYGRPAIVISVDENGIARGSGRSIEGYSLYDALSFSKDTLIQFGGHTLAAGFSVKNENIEAFRSKMNEYASLLPPFFPTLPIDLRLNPQGICPEILDSLSLLEPFGAGNPSPYFGLFGMKITAVKSIGGEKHLRLTLSKDNVSVTAVYFGQSVYDFPYAVGDTVDVAVKTEKNEFRGEVRVSVQVKDIRPCGEDDNGLFLSLHTYRRFIRGEKLTSEEKVLLCPDRALLSAVFRYIREQKEFSFSEEILCMRINCPYIKAGAVRVCLDALTECNIIENKSGKYTLTSFSGKADLMNCEILRKLGFVG